MIGFTVLKLNKIKNQTLKDHSKGNMAAKDADFCPKIYDFFFFKFGSIQ